MTTLPPPQRFGMTPPPVPGGKPGDYEEKLAQWFLEETFFVDFVHRNPAGQVPIILEAPFRTHVFSLYDFMQLTNRFDTAADLICYLDYRDDLKSVLPRRVHDEFATLHGIVRHAGDALRRDEPDIKNDVLERSVRMLRRQASGELLSSPDWKYGLLIDDIIARLHEQDPSLPWNREGDPSGVGQVIERLAWLNRARRIALGKRL